MALRHLVAVLNKRADARRPRLNVAEAVGKHALAPRDAFQILYRARRHLATRPNTDADTFWAEVPSAGVGVFWKLAPAAGGFVIRYAGQH